MKIGINCQHILLTPTGPVYHLIESLKALLKYDKNSYYVLYFMEQPSKEFLKELLGENKNAEVKVLKTNISWTHFSLLKELFINPVDTYFTSVHTLPFLIPNKTRVISMIHGIEYIQNAQYKKNPIKKFIHPFILWYVYTKSNIVVVPSVATKETIFHKFKFINKGKVRIVKEGINKSFYKHTEEEYRHIFSKYGISQPFIYFISTIQPRKNIPRLVEGFKEALKNKSMPKNLSLVIAGKKGWEFEESLKAPTRFKIQESVKFLGHIDMEDRAALMSACEFFISPSLQEGFGLTLLEALACKTPATVSNIEAHKEIGKNYVRYFNPESVEEIAKAIEEMLLNPINQNTLIAEAKHANSYSWEETARELHALFTN